MFWLGKKFEDIKGVIIFCKSKDRQHNCQKKIGQTTIYKILHRKQKIEKHEPDKGRGELRCSGRVSKPCSTSDTRRVTLVTNSVISHEWGNFDCSSLYWIPIFTYITIKTALFKLVPPYLYRSWISLFTFINWLIRRRSLVSGVWVMVFNTTLFSTKYFSYIVTASFIDGGRKPAICSKSLANFIIYCCIEFHYIILYCWLHKILGKIPFTKSRHWYKT